MEKESFGIKAKSSDEGKRLDKFLADTLPEKFSRAFIQKLISERSVLVNNLPVKNHHKVMAGDDIRMTIPLPVPSSIKGEEIALDIVYEDDDLMVVNKPLGMVVHPAPGNYEGTLVNAVLGHCKNLSGIGGVLKPGIVHRIDKGTSGLLVVAKTDRAHAGLAKQFKAKTIKRVYVAIVKGVVELDNGIIELPIGRHSRDRKKMAISFADSSREARTQYKVLKRFKDFTLLELTLGTGRTHQIRVHMTHIGYSILGDDKYGNARGAFHRLALHAKTLGFVHPVTGKYMEFTSDLPEDMVKLIEGRF